LVYSGAAYYLPEGGERMPVLIWDFEDDSGQIVELLQWADEEFEVYKGRVLEEWEIENVLHR